MEENKAEELVLCVPTALFRKVGYFQGVNPDYGKYFTTLLREDQAMYVARETCESNPELKQIIPYLVLTYMDHYAHCVNVLRYTRTKASGEGRLRGLSSIGIGGHINQEGTDPAEAFRIGWMRELSEEVRLDTTYSVKPIGVVNDDSNSVGKVHLGFVLELRVQKPCVYPIDHSAEEMYFTQVESLTTPQEFEIWSQLVLGSKVLIPPQI